MVLQKRKECGVLFKDSGQSLFILSLSKGSCKSVLDQSSGKIGAMKRNAVLPGDFSVNLQRRLCILAYEGSQLRSRKAEDFVAPHSA